MPTLRHIKACLQYGGRQGSNGNQSSLGVESPEVDPLQLIPMATTETMLEIHQRTQVKARISLFSSSAVRTRYTWEGTMRGVFLTSSSPFSCLHPTVIHTASLLWSYRVTHDTFLVKAGATEAQSKSGSKILLINEEIRPGQANRVPTMRKRGLQRHREC